jgi:hypothetical protein
MNAVYVEKAREARPKHVGANVTNIKLYNKWQDKCNTIAWKLNGILVLDLLQY